MQYRAGSGSFSHKGSEVVAFEVARSGSGTFLGLLLGFRYWIRRGFRSN
jgi:hypothetical protein